MHSPTPSAALRILLWTGGLATVTTTTACQTEPVGRFVLVDQNAQSLDAEPEATSVPLTDATFSQCPQDDWQKVKDLDDETGERTTRDVESNTTVRVGVYDTITSDPETVDGVLIDSLSRTLAAISTVTCGPDGAPPPAPMFCEQGADATSIVDGSDAEALCDPWWLECYAALADLERSSRRSSSEDDGESTDEEPTDGESSSEPFSAYPWINDGRFIAPTTADKVREQCTCSSSASDLRAANETIEDEYPIDDFYRVYYGDSTLTLVNDAPSWTPKDPSAGEAGNAGICGAWLYSDRAFRQLEQAGPEGEPSLVQSYCGGIPVLNTASAADQALQPLTTLWLGRNDNDRSLRLGGTGDLVNAWILAGTDDPSRTCPTCKSGRGNNEDTCAVASGAAQLIFSDDLRYRASIDGGPVHLLLAECAPRVDSAELGWQQACWHVQLSQNDLAPGAHLRVGVGGYGPTVARDTAVLESADE